MFQLATKEKMACTAKAGFIIDVYKRQGLYSAGDCSGGFFAHNYPEYIVGVAIGRTLTEGYRLGDELAKA